MNLRRSFALALICVGVGSPLPLFAESNLDETPLKIEVEVAPVTDAVFAARDIIVTIRSRTGGVEVRDLTLLTSGILKAARPDFDQTLNTSSQSDTSLASNESREYRIHIDPVRVRDIIWKPSLMRFPEGAQTVTIRVHFDQPMAGEKWQNNVVPMQFAANGLSIASGGALGGLVAAIFVWVVRSRDERAAMRLSGAVKEIVLNVAVGGLAAWILSYLGEITKQLNVGVTLSATNFQGGVIIGLFSYKIGEALVKSIKGSRKGGASIARPASTV